MSAGSVIGQEFAIKATERPEQGELTRDEVRDFVNLGLRSEWQYAQARQVQGMPELTGWEKLTDGEQKLEVVRKILKFPLWFLSETMGDMRTRGLKHNPLVTPYGNLIMPWPEELLRHMDVRDFIDRMQVGRFDQMVLELGDAGKLLPGQAADELYLGLGSSTGEAPSLRQYYFGLKAKQKMEAIVSQAKDWEEASRGLRSLQSNIASQLKEIYGLPENIKVLFTQSGTEAELLLSLFGVEASQFFNETGSATKAALSGNHPSEATWMGKIVKGAIAGLEKKIVEPMEINLRDEKGEIRDSREIRGEVEKWIIDQQKESPGRRLSLHVVAGGSKTGISFQGGNVTIGGLKITDAEWLRNKYGGESGKGIIIAVDLAQNRLEIKEVIELLEKKMLVNITGSKFPGGAMFSHAMLVPPELAEVMRDWVKENGIPEGLKDYLTKGDLGEILSDEEMQVLPDFPDITSMCKWAEVMPTMKEFATIENDPRERRRFLTLTFDLMNSIRTKILEMGQASKAGRVTWRAEWLNKRQPFDLSFEESIGLQALESFFIEVMGRRLSVAEVKEVYLHIADFRLDQGIHLGQAVEIDQDLQEAVLRIAPSMEFLLRLIHETRYGQGNFREIVAQKIADKLDGVIESGFITAVPVLSSLGEKSELWQKWLIDNNAVFETFFKRCETMEQKLHLSVSLLAQMWKSGRVAPVIVSSGKNAAVLETAHLAYQEAELKGEMPVAFVDHPYVRPETRANFRAALLRYRKLGTPLHLYVFAASEEMKHLAQDEAIKKMVTIVSDAQPPHQYVEEHPKWMEELSVEQMTVAEFNRLDETEFKRRQAIARELNQHYKGKPTVELIDYFKKKFDKITVQFLRGNSRRQAFRQDVQLMELPKSRSFMMLHPLVCFSKEDIVELMKEHHVLVGEEYDPFKEVAESLKCGTDRAFSNS